MVWDSKKQVVESILQHETPVKCTIAREKSEAASVEKCQSTCGRLAHEFTAAAEKHWYLIRNRD